MAHNCRDHVVLGTYGSRELKLDGKRRVYHLNITQSVGSFQRWNAYFIKFYRTSDVLEDTHRRIWAASYTSHRCYFCSAKFVRETATSREHIKLNITKAQKRSPRYDSFSPCSVGKISSLCPQDNVSCKGDP